MFDFEKRSQSIGQQTVLCVGDLMLDDFVYGDVSRISPEAPAPVIAVKRSETGRRRRRQRGAQRRRLGARCVFVGVVGDDEAGRDGHRAAAGRAADRAAPGGRPVAADHAQGALRLRASSPPICCAPTGSWPSRSSAEIEDALIEHALAALPRVGAVVLSDYAKGVLTPRVIRAVIDRGANKLGKPVIVDPKGMDFSIYRGATLITPNRKELAEATRHAGRDRRRDRRRRRRTQRACRQQGRAGHAQRGRA